MSETRNTARDESLENGKLFVLSPKSSAKISRPLIKASIAVFILLSFLFFIFSAFVHKSRWRCPESKSLATVMRNSVDRTADDQTTNISHVVFGIAGSIRTWDKRRGYSDLWWKPNVTRGYVWLDEKPLANLTWSATSPPYRISEDTSRFNGSQKVAIRLSRIVVESFRIGLENVRWFVMGDDDTVFFTENLVGVLSKYDHEKFYYIGEISESVEQDVTHSYGLAFGGGGYAISYALAAELSKVMDGCLDRYTELSGGDQRVQVCITELGVPLTREPGFHQVDVRGNPYGLLAAHPIAPLVSIHHLGHVATIVPYAAKIDAVGSLVRAARADPPRVLQQSFCVSAALNWSVSVSWGYTVQIYPSILRAKELATPLQTFRTWRSFGDGPFTFNTRPLNDDACERPVIFFLDQVKEVYRTEVLTGFKRYGPDPWTTCDQDAYLRALKIENVTIVSTKMEPDAWNKDPRRQCCEIGHRVGEESFQVRIRKCNPGETLSLP